MKKRRGILPQLTILGTATIGLVMGHYVDYVLAIPEHGHRQEFLASTGHGYLPTALAFAIVASVVSVVAAVTLGYRRGATEQPRDWNLVSVGIRLSGVQVAGFITLETLERLLGGGSFIRFLLLLFTGTIVQVLLGFVGAAILVLLERAAEIVARILRRVASGKTSTAPFPLTLKLANSSSFDPQSIRGPPVAFASLI